MDFCVKTVEISEVQLFNIPQFTEELESEDLSIKEAGVFKVVLPDSVRGGGTSLQEFLSLKDFDKRLSVAEKQIITGFGHCPNLYAHRSFDAEQQTPFCTPEEVNDYIQSVKSPSNWVNQESCCETILDTDGEQSLVLHFFNDVICKLANCKAAVCSTKLSAARGQGKRDAANIDKFISGQNSLTPEQRLAQIESALLSDKRPVKDNCECDGCSIKNSKLPEKGVMYGKGVEVLVSDRIRMTKSFGLFCLASTSLLRLLKQNFPGISLPFLYYGTVHSIFPAHVEDFSLYSWNHLHFGKAKIWVVVPPSAVLRLTLRIMEMSPHLIHSSCMNLLEHKYFIPTPKWLRENHINFKVVVQREGESVVVSPNAVRWGWNTGFNIAEACNFATTSWVPYGIVAPRCNCMGGEVHMDLKRLVAAARPDLLQCLVDKSLPKGEQDSFYTSILRVNDKSILGHQVGNIETDNEKEEEENEDEVMEDVFPDLPKQKVGRKAAVCPKVSCSKRYKYSNKQKVLRHILKWHAKDKNFPKLTETFKTSFPERNKVLKKTCCLCGKKIAGRGAQMKRHQRSPACQRQPHK